MNLLYLLCELDDDKMLGGMGKRWENDLREFVVVLIIKMSAFPFLPSEKCAASEHHRPNSRSHICSCAQHSSSRTQVLWPPISLGNKA
jgi:hypothetical protein